jgi:hypothetical protein
MLRLSCLAVTGLVLLLAACGGTLYLTMNGTSPRPPAEVFDCLKSQIPLLGYTQTSFDADAQRLTAQKRDDKTRLADTQFFYMKDRLVIEVGKPSGGGARLKIEARTLAEMSTYRGPTEVEQSASPAVKEAAQKLLEACGS